MTGNPEQAKNNRLIFLSIVGIPITIVLAATWLWFFVARGDIDLIAILGTSNHGTLVQPPRALHEAGLQSGGTPLAYAELEPQWTFLIPGSGDCDANCEGALYLTRQIHLAMGNELKRIRRFYVADTQIQDTLLEPTTLSDKRLAPDDFQAYLDGEQRGIKAFTVTRDTFVTLFPEYSADRSTWYLVDPAGWIMMSYNSSVSYKDVMGDLKFLLKNSTE